MIVWILVFFFKLSSTCTHIWEDTNGKFISHGQVVCWVELSWVEYMDRCVWNKLDDFDENWKIAVYSLKHNNDNGKCVGVVF